LRLKYRSKNNYESGFAVFHTQEDVSERKDKGNSNDFYPARPERKAREHIAILSLKFFLIIFANPDRLADAILARANQVVRAWNETNSGHRMTGKRRPLTVTWILTDYEWKNSRGKIERSQYTLQISSFGFTNANQQTKRPIITLKDLKVCPPSPRPPIY
jgi:hypothetical protein